MLTGEIWGACWLAGQLVISFLGAKIFGSVDAGGMPRWRSAVGLPTQAVILPLQLCLSGGEASTVSAAAFRYVFPSYMLLDFALLKVEPLLTCHHLACLLGHWVVCSFTPEGFSTYFAGVVSLEAGSACLNFYWLSPEVRWRGWFCLVGMTSSNLCAAWVLFRWVQLPLSAATKFAMGFVTVLILVFREKEAIALFPGGLPGRGGKVKA